MNGLGFEMALLHKDYEDGCPLLVIACLCPECTGSMSFNVLSIPEHSNGYEAVISRPSLMGRYELVKHAAELLWLLNVWVVARLLKNT